MQFKTLIPCFCNETDVTVEKGSVGTLTGYWPGNVNFEPCVVLLFDDGSELCYTPSEVENV